MYYTTKLSSHTLKKPHPLLSTCARSLHHCLDTRAERVRKATESGSIPGDWGSGTGSGQVHSPAVLETRYAPQSWNVVSVQRYVGPASTQTLEVKEPGSP